ncbi:MAG: Sulfite reductase [NADPH] flavoprotein alpha-component [Methanobacteriota archaeon]|nr:MAG: Sulfite reductase [NADPH] flavoprotein alpha-component [Euryarchaeota archaeon]
MSNDELLIIVGTETGNAEALADDAKIFANKVNLNAKVMDMDDVSVEEISNSKYLLICCSTWGEGDQPTNAEDLYEETCNAANDCMNGVNFAVLALGDTSYEFFCESGKQWDVVMEEKGGTRIQSRIDCDVDYEDDDECEEWIKQTVDIFNSLE